MSSEKEFRDILRNKLGEKSFGYDPANWEEARKLILASREEKKRRPFIFLFFSLFLLLGGVVCFYFLVDPVTEKNQVVSLNNGANTVDKELKEASAKNEDGGTSSGNKKEKIKVNKTTKAAEPAAKETETIISENKKQAEKASTDQNNKQSKLPDVSNKTEIKTQKPEGQEHTSGLVMKSGNTKVRKTKDAGTSQNGKNIFTGRNFEILPFVFLDKNETMLPVVPNDAYVASNAPSTNALDSISAILSSLVKPRKTLKYVIGVEAGFNYMLGWKYNTQRDGNGYNPHIGVFYSSPFLGKMNASVGINYFSVGHLSYSSHVSKITRYGLGEEGQFSVFTPTKLHYLSVPLKLSYSHGKKQTIGLGCNFAYLLTVAGKLETYTKRLNTIENRVFTKTHGYTEGFKTFDTQLSIFYGRSIYKDLWINAELMCGLKDIKDNTFFDASVFERNAGIKITLIYNIFKK